MKNKSDFLDSVFSKSDAIFKTRRQRKKVLKTVIPTSLCALLICTVLLRLPDLAPKSFAPEAANDAAVLKPSSKEDFDGFYSDSETKGNADTGDVGQRLPLITDAPVTAEIKVSPEIKIPDQKNPKYVEIKIFSSSTTVYKGQEDIEKITELIPVYYALEQKQENAVLSVCIAYEDESILLNMGKEFLDLLNEQ